jgi:hypothetical protein
VSTHVGPIHDDLWKLSFRRYTDFDGYTLKTARKFCGYMGEPGGNHVSRLFSVILSWVYPFFFFLRDTPAMFPITV